MDPPRFKMAEDGERFRVLSSAYFFAAVALAIVLTLLVWAATYGYLVWIDQLRLAPALPSLWVLLVLLLLAGGAWWLSRRAFAKARSMQEHEAASGPPPGESDEGRE